MGMYTALSLGVELNITRDSQVAKLLSYMVGDAEEAPKLALLDYDEANQSHPFFSCSRWNFMLRCDSYYFDWDTRFVLRWDTIAESYFLTGVCNLKNYSGEIQQFLDWLNPYIHDSSQGFIGWTMYEEDWMPTILMRRRLKKDANAPDIIPLYVEHLFSLAVQADELVEQLVDCVGDCVIDRGELNNFLIGIGKYKRTLL